MNEARLEELKKILNERHQNLEQSSREDFSAQNFDIPNSDVSNFDASDSSIGNIKDDLKFQNLHSDKAAFKNSKAQVRDYDKDPIIIKDHTYFDYMKYSIIPTIVGLLIALAVATIVNPINIKMFRLVPLVLVIFVTNFMNRDGAYFVFYNDKILYYNKNKIRKTFELNKIGAMVLSFDWRWSWKQKIPIFIKIFLVIWFLLGWLATGEPINGVAIIFTFCFSILTTKAYMHLLNGSLGFFGLHDQLVLYKENAEVEILNILMATEDEHLQLRDYFMQTMQKDISNLQRTMSIFNEKIEFRKFKF